MADFKSNWRSRCSYQGGETISQNCGYQRVCCSSPGDGEPRWNDINRGKAKNSDKNLCQWQFVRQKFLPGFYSERSAANLLSHGTADCELCRMSVKGKNRGHVFATRYSKEHVSITERRKETQIFSMRITFQTDRRMKLQTAKDASKNLYYNVREKIHWDGMVQKTRDFFLPSGVLFIS